MIEHHETEKTVAAVASIWSVEQALLNLFIVHLLRKLYHLGQQITQNNSSLSPSSCYLFALLYSLSIDCRGIAINTIGCSDRTLLD